MSPVRLLRAFVLVVGSAALVSFLTGPIPTPDARGADDEPKLAPGGFGGRTDKGKEHLLKADGGTNRSEAAVAAGLAWLGRHQAEDGSWNLSEFHKDGKCNCGNPGRDDRVTGTALAVLPFLGAGETARGGVSKPTYARNVERALKWLIAKQNAEGEISKGEKGSRGYPHAMATMALCEAYGMTKDPALKGPAQKAIDAAVKWQHQAGGWRYDPKEAGDTDVTGAGWSRR